MNIVRRSRDEREYWPVPFSYANDLGGFFSPRPFSATFCGQGFPYQLVGPEFGILDTSTTFKRAIVNKRFSQQWNGIAK